MSKLVSIGELLIDFQSQGTGSLKDTDTFVKKAGGAPANVCVQAAKLGCKTVYLTQVGNDGFGEFLIETLQKENVDTAFIRKSNLYDTSLAFVSFKESGEREFSFYRRTAADLHFSAEDFADVTFEKGDILEFGSVALKTPQARAVHDFLIAKAKQAGATICFDPNVRLNLWEDRNQLKRIILRYAAKCDVLKISDDEVEFVVGGNAETGARKFLRKGVSVVALTKGGAGAKVFTNGKQYVNPGYKVKVVDTTGAGDSFFGGFLSELLNNGITTDNLSETDYQNILDFACKCGSYTTTGYGAISAMGSKKDINKIGE